MTLHQYIKVQIDQENVQSLEHFIALLYDNTSALEQINENRQKPFCKKDMVMESVSPVQEALSREHALQQTKQAAFQSGIWCTCE